MTTTVDVLRAAKAEQGSMTIDIRTLSRGTKKSLRTRAAIRYLADRHRTSYGIAAYKLACMSIERRSRLMALFAFPDPPTRSQIFDNAEDLQKYIDHQLRHPARRRERA